MAIKVEVSCRKPGLIDYQFVGIAIMFIMYRHSSITILYELFYAFPTGSVYGFGIKPKPNVQTPVAAADASELRNRKQYKNSA